MFGNIAACRHTLGDQHEAWMAALCGTCLGVRDAAGQLARPLLVTDAVALAVLAHEASGGAGSPATVPAGRCPGRGLQRADVLPATSHPVRVGVAAALLAATVTLDDAATDGDLRGGELTARVAAAGAARLRRHAVVAASIAGVDHALVLAAVRSSTEAEQTRTNDLDAWLRPVEAATGELFRAAAATGTTGDAPSHGAVLQAIGAAVGRATLLADAVGDLEADRRSGAPNPIAAGACTTEDALGLTGHAATDVEEAVHRLTGDGLASALWGPAWQAGLRRSAGTVLGPVRHPPSGTQRREPAPTGPGTGRTKRFRNFFGRACDSWWPDIACCACSCGDCDCCCDL